MLDFWLMIFPQVLPKNQADHLMPTIKQDHPIEDHSQFFVFFIFMRF